MTTSPGPTPRSWSSGSASTPSTASRTMFDPIKSLIRSAATVGDQQPDFYSDNRSPELLLQHPAAQRQDRQRLCRLGRRLVPPGPPDQPGGRDPGQAAAGRRRIRLSLDRCRKRVADRSTTMSSSTPAQKDSAASEQATTYDPRPRSGTADAVADGTLIITDPDVFAALGLIGFTVAAPFSADGEMRGRRGGRHHAGRPFANTSAEHKISPGTLSYMLDQQGGVLANSELSQDLHQRGRDRSSCSTSRRSTTELPRDRLQRAAATARGMFSLYPWRQRVRRQPVDAAAPNSARSWQLFTVTPLADFTGAFDPNNKRLLRLRADCDRCWQILIIYFLSAVISSPLETARRQGRQDRGFRQPSSCRRCARRSARSRCCPRRSTRSTSR